MTIEALDNNKELISLQSLKAFCKIGDLETAFDEELKSALSAAIRRAESITGLKLTLGSYKISGYDERRLISPFYSFTSCKLLAGVFAKRGTNLYELRGEVEGEALMGFFTDDLLKADEKVKSLLDKAKIVNRTAGVGEVQLFAAALIEEEAPPAPPPADETTQDNTAGDNTEDLTPPAQDEPAPPVINGGLPDLPLPPLPPADDMDKPAHQPQEGEEQPPQDENIVSPLPLDGTLPLNEEDVSTLRNALIKAGFLPLPEDIALWLKNYVYTSFKKESWDHAKNDKVLNHYRLGNYF